MNSINLRDVRAGVGPGTRGKGCDICMEDIAVDSATVTHITCENVFHKTCLDEWCKSNSTLGRTTTCPKCRGVLNEGFWQMFTSAPSLSSPSANPSFQLMTSSAEMYDYDVNLEDAQVEEFPTPAFIHRFYHDHEAATSWLGDYFVRLRLAQTLSDEEAFVYVMDCYELLDNARLPRNMEQFVGELQEGEMLTDVEIISVNGSRRIRPDVVDFFEKEPSRAYDWLQHRMARTQDNLFLDYGEMYDLREYFMMVIHREIRI